VAEDYYAVLKVPRDASIEDIQDALRQENMKWSRRSNNAPRAADRHEAEQRVELLAQAKSVLTDPARRAQYDASIGIAPRAPVMNPVDSPWPRVEQPQPQPQPPMWPPPQPSQPKPEMWPPPNPPRSTDGRRSRGPLEQAGEGAANALDGFVRRLFGRQPGGTATGARIRHPIWTTLLVLFAIIAFAAAGNGQSPASNVIVGIVALLIAWRVSGLWRRRR
jgi:curved DNA-binding protein CbpA